MPAGKAETAAYWIGKPRSFLDAANNLKRRQPKRSRTNPKATRDAGVGVKKMWGKRENGRVAHLEYGINEEVLDNTPFERISEPASFVAPVVNRHLFFRGMPHAASGTMK